MFSGKQRWALRVIEELDLDVESREATKLADMLIVGADPHEELVYSDGQKLKDHQLILMTAAIINQDQSATNRLIDELGISPGEAVALLNRVREAGRTLAAKKGETEILQKMYGRKT